MHPPRLLFLQEASILLQQNCQCRGYESFHQVEPLNGVTRSWRMPLKSQARRMLAPHDSPSFLLLLFRHTRFGNGMRQRTVDDV